MEPDEQILAGRVLHLVRTGMSAEIPLEAADIQSTSATRIVETFRARFAKASDAGVRKRLSNAVLELANPFDVKARRQLRPEALILGTLLFAAMGLAVYFNLSAVAR
jgi:hypothetical protein